MNKKLSILICTLEEREGKLKRLLDVLNPQINENVEIIVKSDSGQMSIGTKRNALLHEATGEYISFIDDDDLVSDNYVTKILEAIKTNPDCCGLKGTITFQGQCPKTFIHSIQYKNWFEENGIYYRCPNHLNPVKRELALQTSFKEISFGEDRDYSIRLSPLIQKEEMIEDHIYYYLYEKSGPPNSGNNTNKKKNKRISRRIR